MQIEKRCPALVTNHAGTMNLLFHDFNSGSRQFRFGMNNNVILASKGDFRRTRMTGAQLIDKNVIDIMENNFIFNFIRFNLKFHYLNPTYTHTKLMKPMTITWFRVILQNFIESWPFEFILREDSTLSMYAENYRNQAQILINLYNYS